VFGGSGSVLDFGYGVGSGWVGLDLVELLDQDLTNVEGSTDASVRDENGWSCLIGSQINDQ
jgi:hypothetical protein